ncbi:MAG: SMC family ATPase [Nanoarchaeota archaeon]|nr:SMC family ATPase [Nanoarchaeota archaeon]
MKLKKLKIKNIRSYEEGEVIFPEGSLLLSGDIGSGKSSILMALEYALFGLQPGQKGNSLLRNSEDSGEVSLEFEVNNKLAIIERRLKRTPRGVSNEYAAITIDGEKTESSITEIKQKIVTLLGYPQEFVKKNNVLYRFTVHTAQEQMKQIILEDPESRINILRHIFGVEKYRRVKNNLSLFLTNLKGEIKMLQGEISTLEEDKKNLLERKSSLSSLEEKIIQKKSELNEKIGYRKNLELELRNFDQKISQKNQLDRETEKSRILISTKREILSSLIREESEIQNLLAKITPFNESQYISILEEIKKTKSDMEELSQGNAAIYAKQNSIKEEMKESNFKKERIFKIDICPTCLQDVSENHKHNILNETERNFSNLRKTLANLDSQKILFSEKLSQTKNKLSLLEEEKTKLDIIRSRVEQLESNKVKLNEIKKQKNTLEEDITMLQSHTDQLKEKLLTFSTLDIQFKRKESEVQEAFQIEKNVEISLAELEKELEISKREINFFEGIISKKEESKKKLYEKSELTDWLSSGFLKLIDLMERNVLLTLRKEFSLLFRKWFMTLVSDSTLDSQIDDNFTPVIIQGETEMDYSFLSGGERTAVALAYRLALNQTINSLMSKIRTRGLMILDEPTDGFSEQQINKVRDILDEINASQLIIVSHEQKIESFVDNVIRVTKEQGLSSIESLNQISVSQSEINQKT